MIPTRWVVLEALPLSAAGKLDRTWAGIVPIALMREIKEMVTKARAARPRATSQP